MLDTTKPPATLRIRSIGRFDPLILALLVALGILVTVIGAQKPAIFFLPVNLLNIGQAVTMIGLVAMAQSLVIIMGGLDLSVGSIVGLVSISVALAMKDNNNLPVGIAAGLLVGGFVGMINGVLVTRGKIEPVIATLGTMAVYRGAAFILTNGAPIGIMSKPFNLIGSGKTVGIPNPLVVLIVVTILFYIFLNYTDLGRNIFAIGGNAVAARFSGINIQRYRMGVYILSGIVAGIAAIILTARSNAGQPNSGTGLELEAITAAALGGTAMTGGRGSILGVVLGVLIIGVMNNGMILLGVSQFYQFIARGLLLVIAVLIQRWLRRG